MRTKESKIVEIGVEEGVDLATKIKESLLPKCGVIWGGEFFYHSMFCKWTTSLASTWVICH